MSEATRARHGRAWMPVVVVVALFVLVVVAAALQGAAGFEPRFAPEAVEPPAAVPGASEGPSVAPEPEDVPDVVIDPGPDPTLGAVTAIVIAGLVAVALVALRRALRGMRTRARPTAAEVDITTSFAATPTADADVGAVREGIDEAIERIETPGAARDAVVAAWAELEAAAAAAGLARAASETQAEFAVRVLGRVHAAESTVALLRIYEGVRYGGRTPTAADVNAARGHLQVIRQVWR